MANKHSYITPEFQMVLAIMKNIIHKVNAPLPKIEFDQNKLLTYFSTNNVNAFIAAHIDNFPELIHLKAAIVRRAKRSLNKNLLLQADLLRLIDLGHREKINIVLFKGHPVNEMIYGNNNSRTSTDVDICILPSDIKKLEQLLLQNGYVVDRPDFEMDEKEFELFLKVDNEKSYFSPTRTKLDVHFKLFKNPYLLELPENPSEYLIQEQYCNRKMYRLNNAYTLLYLMVHGKIHQWEKMMWLLDIVLFLRKFNEEEIQAAYELALKNKLENIFLGTISLCNVAFEMPIPECLKNKIGNKHAAYVVQGLKTLAGKNVGKFSAWKQRVFMKLDFQYTIYQLSIFPIRDMKIVRVPFAKRILYPLLRPITYLIS